MREWQAALVKAGVNPGTIHKSLVVSLLAYAGLRPGELRAQRLGDAGETTILVEPAANPDGSIKATKNEQRRAVRLLSPLAQDLREYRLAIGRPSDATLLLVDDEGNTWDKTAGQMWRVDRWVPACRAVGLDPVPRPYECAPQRRFAAPSRGTLAALRRPAAGALARGVARLMRT